jgi:hypothetical protein
MDWNKKIYEALREIEQALREEFAQRKQKSEATIVPDEWLTSVLTAAGYKPVS